MRVLTALLLVCMSFGFWACDDDDDTSDSRREITVGAILSLSGSLSDFGTSGEAAIELALADVNQRSDLDVRFKSIRIEDSRTNPDSALAIIKRMHDQGIRVVIGPQSSAEVEAVRTYADANDMIVISPSSVSRTLSIADDNVFRFAPDDSFQAEAMAKLMTEDGRNKIITVSRRDVWGNDLLDLFETKIEPLGGELFASLKYDPAATDFSSTLGQVATAVEQLVNTVGSDKIGVYLLTFGEGATILEQAAANSALADVNWYGASAVAQSFSLLDNSTAVGFAESTGYPCPVYGLDADAKTNWEPFRARLKAQTQRDADIYALNAYDIVQVIAETFDETGNNDAAEFKSALVNVAAAYDGVTGPVVLNAAGDRQPKSLDFWAIQDVDGEATWVRVAEYNALNGELSR